MLEFFQMPMVRATLLFGVVVSLIMILAYVVGRLRGSAEEDEPHASDLLTKFREMHAEGVLSDEEYRTIKTNLTARLQSELKDSEGKG